MVINPDKKEHRQDMDPNFKPKPFTIVFFYSRIRNVNNSSIAFLFTSIQNSLSSFIRTRAAISKYYSNGLWRRIYNTVEAAFRQGDINHITGDTYYLALLLKKKKTIITFHDCGFMTHPSKLARFVLRCFWLAWPISRSKVVTVVSQATKDEILKYVDCPPEKIHVIHNFISGKYTPFRKPFNSEKPVILHIGTAPNKNLERLIAALEGVNCQLTIIGKLNDTYISLLKKHGIDYLNAHSLLEDEVVEHYRKCDLLAFVSTYEGFGMPILEAQTTGRAVVTSNVLSMPEVAGNGACLVDPYSITSIRGGILKVINDEEYRQQVIEKGLENVKKYDFASTRDKYALLYEEMISKKQVFTH